MRKESADICGGPGVRLQSSPGCPGGTEGPRLPAPSMQPVHSWVLSDPAFFYNYQTKDRVFKLHFHTCVSMYFAHICDTVLCFAHMCVTVLCSCLFLNVAHTHPYTPPSLSSLLVLPPDPPQSFPPPFKLSCLLLSYQAPLIHFKCIFCT